MTDASMPSSRGAPRDVLADLDDLTRAVRAAQRGAWFPLLMFGLFTLGGVLANRLTFKVRTLTDCPPFPGSAHPAHPAPTVCTAVTQGSPLYWTLGLALAYAVTAFFYVRRSRARGVGTAVRPYIVTGICLVALVAATGFWAKRHLTGPGGPVDFWGLHLDPASGLTQFLERFTGGAAAVGVPLLVLSWVERSRALLLFALAYLAIELAPIAPGWAGISVNSPWSGLVRLGIPAAFLLLGSLAFALAQLPGRRALS